MNTNTISAEAKTFADLPAARLAAFRLVEGHRIKSGEAGNLVVSNRLIDFPTADRTAKKYGFSIEYLALDGNYYLLSATERGWLAR